MKVAFSLFVIGFIASSPINAGASSAASNPVSGVVELLKKLSAQVEAEGKKEEDLYETFVCWAKSVIEQKTASNSEAGNRIDALSTYIADLDAGRVELTSERVDLEKEVAETQEDIETATAMRTKEKKDFKDASDEMNKAITGLKSAIAVLAKASKDHKTGSLIAVRQSLKGGMQALFEEQSNLQNAVELGSRFLGKADALFLRRVLLGEVPEVDNKKLNRKAGFKMKYKARSFKIQDVLAKMLQTFELNLKDATESEASAAKQFAELEKTKTAQLEASRKSMTKMESETGARGLSREDSANEVKALKTQVADDQKFIKETEAALETKKEEWKARQVLRSGELEAISKAISILYNDDARDLMKKSFSSQGFFFLQERMTSEQKVATGAVAALREAARRSGDERLSVILSMLDSPESVKVKFDPILKAIDKMLEVLSSDEAKDLKTKETCEKDRMSDTRKALLASRDIDDMTDKVSQLEDEITKLNAEIKALQADYANVKKELAAASKIRKEQQAAWVQTDQDDAKAAETIKMAKGVLEKFYEDNKLAFIQATKAPVVGLVDEGDAPPPPPTWEGGYGGKPSEASGIISILQMVYEDALKDKAKAKEEEDNSQKEYETFKKDSEKQMKDLKSEENDKAKVKGKKETDKTDTEKSRATKKGELDGTLENINAINPSCEYFEVNYELRRKNRQIEVDGLQKAKALLKVGSFAMSAANFLQRRR